MQALTQTLMFCLWATPCSYDYSWNWGQQHTLENATKDLSYSAVTYPQGQIVLEIKHRKETVFQGVIGE